MSVYLCINPTGCADGCPLVGVSAGFPLYKIPAPSLFKNGSLPTVTRAWKEFKKLSFSKSQLSMVDRGLSEFHCRRGCLMWTRLEERHTKPHSWHQCHASDRCVAFFLCVLCVCLVSPHYFPTWTSINFVI